MSIADDILVPAEAFPPGMFLAEELEARDWSIVEFAEILGRPTQVVSEIINGHKEITAETAVELGAALGTSAELWLRLEDSYRLWRAGQDTRVHERYGAVRRRSRLASVVPLRELIRRGVIDAATLPEQEQQVCALLGIRSLDERPAVAAAARRGSADEPPSSLQVAWLACARQAIRSRRVERFSRSGLRDLAERLASLVRSPGDLRDLPGRFAEVGVALVHVAPFPRGRIDGAAFDERGHRGIAVSARIARLDSVLFTILHEAAHLQLGQAGIHVDEALEAESTSRFEQEADALARSWLLPDAVPDHSPVSRAFVLALARERGVHPSVIVGRLQHEGRLPWSHLRALTPNVRDDVAAWQ
jgi:HTH-type transcriptional regulator/antitoxin HigA